MKTARKKIGLFFGSFNPIHIGHLIIGNIMLQETGLDEIWYVVSPQNPFKNKKSLLEENLRLNLVKDAIADNNKFKATDIEFALPKPSYTIDTLTYLNEKHKNTYNFNLIMGSDNLINFDKWKNYEQILNQFKIFVYNRPGSEISKFHSHDSVNIVNGPLLHISASMIREYIKQSKSIRYLVSDTVLAEIEKYNYYKGL